MTIQTSVKAGGVNLNHSETLVVRSDVKAGGVAWNHNEALAVRPFAARKPWYGR